MNLLEMKKKALVLIEELSPDSDFLTDDPDIATKLNEVINQVMFDLARIKRIPKYVEIEVNEGDVIDFEAIENASGYPVYQIDTASGVSFNQRASGTILKVLQSGTLCIDFFAYPERITEKTKDKAYEFELSADALEIMPYGIAADLLKSDQSMEYGTIYATKYESMKQMLDQRFQAGTFSVEGGVNI